MSISIEFADGNGGRTEGYDVASNLGWTEFGAWVDALPVGKGFGPLIALWEHGLWYDMPALIAALTKAMKAGKPSKDVRTVAENLLHLASENKTRQGIFVADDS